MNFAFQSAPPVAPKSAARLAAEALFGVPPAPPPATDGPQVVVLRKRSIVIETAAAEPLPQPAAAPTVAAEERQPRVFRAPGTATRQPILAPTASPAVARPRRARRIGHDRRAGAIRMIVSAPPPAEQPASSEAIAMAAREPAYTEALADATRREREHATLIGEIAAVQALLAAARRAREFNLADPRPPA